MLDLLIITLLTCLFAVWLQSRPFIWLGKGVTWKIPLPVVGNTGGLLLDSWHGFWRRFYKEIGDERVLGYHMFSSPALLLKDPQLLKKVMVSDADHFSERELHQEEIDPIGRSLFFVGGPEWKSQRTKITPYFTPARVKAMLPYIEPTVDNFLQAVQRQACLGPVDVQKASLQLSTDVITSNVFGLKADAFENPDSFFFNLQRELLCFDSGLRGMLGILSPSVYRLLRLTFFRPSTIAKLRRFVNDVIAQRLKGVGVRPDFMQGMMELLDEGPDIRAEEKARSNPKEIQSFDRKTVLGQCMLMYTAGTETTGNTLAFILYELALHQHVQDKLRHEILAARLESGDQCAIEHLCALPYLNQVIAETLRKYPVATVIGRKCTRTYVLEGIEIPVGTIMAVPIIAIHHDPRYFPRPEVFDPDRFSATAEPPPQGAYLPFGLGPRTCIGVKFAQTELVLVLTRLLTKFRLGPCDKTQSVLKFAGGPVLSADRPIWLDVQPIF